MADPSKVDIRTVQRQIRKGVLTQEDYEKHLATLPDLEASADFVDYDTKFKIEAEEEARRAALEAAEAAKNPPARPPPPLPATATALAPDRVSLDDDDDIDDEEEDDAGDDVE